ncbi:MAG: hypothetical protein QME77_14450, partial [bacterium]|nr:hypothetical protein [bacterium]
RCYCSIERATAWRRSCGRATPTAPRTGTKCSCQRSSGSSSGARTWSCAPMPLYNKRGTAEQWIKAGKEAVKMGGRLVKHACYYWLLLAEGHLTRRLFGAILRRLVALPGPA